MKYSSSKDLDRIVRVLVRQGWTFSHGGKHGRLLTPCGKCFLTVPATPSCRHAAKNFAGDVKRLLKRQFTVWPSPTTAR